MVGPPGEAVEDVVSGKVNQAGIGLAAGLTKPNDGLGAVGGYAALSNYTALGGTLTVSRCRARKPSQWEARCFNETPGLYSFRGKARS